VGAKWSSGDVVVYKNYEIGMRDEESDVRDDGEVRPDD
jgi:hypothetical protein